MKIYEDDYSVNFHRLEDLDTGEDIADFLWADDKTGEYEVYSRDESGNTKLIISPSGIIRGVETEIKSGNIKFFETKYDLDEAI